MKNSNIILCPNCGESINVDELSYQKIEAEIKGSYDAKTEKQQRELEAQMRALKEQQQRLHEQQEGFDEKVRQDVTAKLRAEKAALEKKLKDQLNSENADLIQSLRNELDEKSKQVKDATKLQIELERIRREKDELGEKIKLETEREFSEKLKSETSRVQKKIEEEQHLRIKEKEKVIEDLQEKLEESSRKAKQGSMQLQGEIQELELESILRENFPNDEIEEIKKGQRGADTIQTVINPSGNICGRIYYESKRTKRFDFGWFQKLREDNLTVKADVLVLVTETMPEGEKGFFFREGVWVCDLWQVKALALLLRHSLVEIQKVRIIQQGKDTKMESLYNYLTGQEFIGQFSAIIEGFTGLQKGYNDEKLKMQKVWKEREKQLEKILTNAVEFYGSVKGIAGASIPDIKMLEDAEDAKQLE